MDEAELNHFPNNLLVYGSEFISPFMIVTNLNLFLFATNKQLRRVTKTLLLKKCWPDRGVVPGGARVAMAPPDFGRSVNPISTKGGRLCPPYNTGSPGFSDLSTALPEK